MLLVGYILEQPYDGDSVLQIDELRISNGPRYQYNFTPLELNQRHTIDEQTVELWHFENDRDLWYCQGADKSIRLAVEGDATKELPFPE